MENSDIDPERGMFDGTKMADAEESQLYRRPHAVQAGSDDRQSLGRQGGVSRTVWADLKRHGNPSRRTMEKLLQAAGSSLAEFEALRG